MNEEDFIGVVILESLNDPDVLNEVTILKESTILAPPDDPLAIWSRKLVRVPSEQIELFATRLAMAMREDFYNHFVDEHSLIVVFKNMVFALDKHDRSTWDEMIAYGETVRVSSRWTENIPIEAENLLS
jgi:hypothetical protein